MSNKCFLIFIILGLAILSVPFFRHHRDAKEAKQYIEEIGDTEDEEEKTDEKAETTGGKKKTANAIPEGAIGIIEIKSLNIRYPIFEGAGSEQLNSGIGHLTESAGLLEKGNCVLAGHNGSTYRSIENWEEGSRKVPDYLLRLMAYRLQIEKRIGKHPEWSGIDSDK